MDLNSSCRHLFLKVHWKSETFLRKFRLIGDLRGGTTVNDTDIDAWYHNYADDVHNYLIYFTGNWDVDDLVQETFLKAMRGMGGFKGLANPKTWLLSIARRIAIDQMRQCRCTNILPPDQMERIPARQVQPDHAIVEREACRTVLEQINGLKNEYREVVFHRVVIGLSIAETAETLGWSESKVKITLHRALKKLRKSLRRSVEEEMAYEFI